MRSFDTPFGEFHSGNDYRDHLISIGYTNYGWQNGWNEENRDKYVETVHGKKCEQTQWNRSGSDVTYVYHDIKVFSSVDMGD